MSPASPLDDSEVGSKPRPPWKAFLFERLGLDVAEALAAKKTVPIHRSTHFYFLGGMALFLFGVQVVTGTLLSLYYKPSPDQAFESVRAIMMRGYRRPREMTWVTGCLLLGLFMAFGFSGYLLPWNELAFFATRVGTAIVKQVPLIGYNLQFSGAWGWSDPFVLEASFPRRI